LRRVLEKYPRKAKTEERIERKEKKDWTHFNKKRVTEREMWVMEE
jgi:hypothetical protein